MDDMMHTPFGDIDPAEVEAAAAAAAAADRAKGEEITIRGRNLFSGRIRCMKTSTEKDSGRGSRRRGTRRCRGPFWPDGKAPPGDRSSVKDQLTAGKKEAAKTHSPKAKTDKKLNKEPEL